MDSGAKKLEMKLEHWWNYGEGVAGQRQASRKDPGPIRLLARCSQGEERLYGCWGDALGRLPWQLGLGIPLGEPGRTRCLPLCAPLPAPATAGARAAGTRPRQRLPLPTVGDNLLGSPPTLSHRVKSDVARPSPCPSSTAAVVAIAVAVTSRPLCLGEGGGGEKEKKQESVCGACARIVACPQTGNQAPLPPPRGNYFLGLVFSAGCHFKCVVLLFSFE